MAILSAKTPEGLFKKIDAQEFAWHPETAKHRANMRNVPVGSLGRMTEKPTWNNETQQFEGGKIEGGTVQLPDQWKYDPFSNREYALAHFDELYSKLYPNK